MAGIKIEGGSNTAGSPNVDANYNLNVTLPTTEAQAGYAKTAWLTEEGNITGVQKFGRVNISEDGQFMIGHVNSMMLRNFQPTSQNTGDNKYVSSTMTCTQSGGFLNINAILSTVSGNYTTFSTWKHFCIQGDGDLNVYAIGQLTAMPPTNQIFEVGLFVPTAGTVPGDGAFFRVTASGVIGVISYGGSETQTNLIVTSIPANTNGEYEISIGQRSVEFYMNGDSIGEIPTPNSQALPYQTVSLPFTYMCRNTGTVTGGAIMKIGNDHVTQEVLNQGKPWAQQQGMQGNSYQGQDGDTMGSNAAYSNSALSAAAALANATAAAPNVGLGGVVLVLPTLTSGTDGILFSYQNPAGSTIQPPKTLVVNGITLDAGVQVALTGGPLNLVMGIAFGHTALSLATAESTSFTSGTTKMPRRVPLGVFSFPVTAAAGTGAQNDITMTFASPIVVNPGEYFAITCRNVGTVTSAGALVMTACVDHFFE